MNPQDRLLLEPMPRLRGAIRPSGLFGPAMGNVVFARAPGRLDIMGGVADYSGSLVCEMPLAIAAGAAVQLRDDNQLVCHSVQESHTVRVTVDLLKERDPITAQRRLDGPNAWSRYAIGCAWWLAQRGAPARGLTMLLDSSVQFLWAVEYPAVPPLR